MFIYILKRLLYFIPTILIISFLTFGISKLAPGDPVELLMGSGDQGGGQQSEVIATEKAYLETAEKLGMHLPSFYFALSSRAYPDTMYKIPMKKERENLDRMINYYGNWSDISNYYHSLKDLEISLFEASKDSSTFLPLKTIRENCNKLYLESNENTIDIFLAEIKAATTQTASLNILKPGIEVVIQNFESVKSNSSKAGLYIPSLKWYGIKNQFHNWLLGDKPWFGGKDKTYTSAGFVRGDFGISYLDKRPVSSSIGDAIKWTFMLNVIAIFIAYLFSIPLGVKTAVKKGTRFDNISTVILFILYSLPSFWIATLCIVFLTTNQYGEWLDWFPTYGLGLTGPDYSVWEKITSRAYHFILPVFCMTYGSYAFISRQMRGGMLNVIKQDFIRTAWSKGLDDKTVIWKHAFRNSLIPIITMFAAIFPAAIGGSVIIEMIFSIPGMGKLSFEAVVARNYPVVFTVLMFSAILTMIGNLVADIMYALVDPRISFTKKAA